MPEPNTGDRNSYGSRLYEFRTAKLRRGSRDVCPRPGTARMIEDYYDFPMGSDFSAVGQSPTRTAMVAANWRGRPAFLNTVDGARFSRRAISFREIPAVLKRSTSRTWRIAILSAGIRSPSAKAKGRTVSSQQRRRSDRHLSGLHHPGTVGEIISERRATSNRIAGRHHPGFAGDFPRNHQPARRHRIRGKPQALRTWEREHHRRAR